MPSTSVQALSMSPNPHPMHDTRTRSSASHPRTTVAAPSAPFTSTSSFPSSSSSSSSSHASTSTTTTTTARPSFNLRDFMVEDDADQVTSTMFKFMDKDAIIRAQVEALEVLDDAALTRALRESEETAALEDEMRQKQRLSKEEELRVAQDGIDTAQSGLSINSSQSVVEQLKREAQAHLSSSPPLTTTTTTALHDRYPSDEAAARLLAREWKVASLQGALLQNPDMLPSVASTQHTSTSSSSLVISTTTITTTKAHKAVPSSARPIPITIPAEEFYSRSPSHPHHRQGSISRSSTSSIDSPPQTSFITPDFKDKPQPKLYTSASSAAAAQAAAKLADKVRNSPTKTSFGSIYASASQSQPASFPLVNVPDNSKRVSAEFIPPHRKSTSPERVRIANAPAAAATSSPDYKPNGQRAHGLSISNKASGAHHQSQPTSTIPVSAEGPRSFHPSISNTLTFAPLAVPIATVMTSASQVAAAAEKEKARNKQMLVSTPASTSSASTSAPVKRTSSPSRPATHEAPSTSTSSPPSPPPPSPSQVPAKPVSPTIKAVVPSLDGDQVPVLREVENHTVVPISSLSKPEDDEDNIEDSEDDDGDVEDEEEEEEEGETEEEEEAKEKEEENTGTEPISFRHLYTANRSCSKCGESIISPRKTLTMPVDPFSFPFIELLHVSCANCGTLHCRGCFSLAKCPKSCLGSKSCSVKDCCPQVCAIAIFEALSAFDYEFSKEVGSSGISKNGRDEFIQAMISRPTSQTKKLELIFVRTMHTLTALFQSSRGVHPTVGQVFERSLMPEIIHGFLRSMNIRDWIAHSDTYSAILTLLRYMVEGGSGDVMTTPLRRIETSCGLKDWVWGRGVIVWASGDEYADLGKEGSKDRERYRGELKGGAEKSIDKGEKEKSGQCVSAAPLGSLMKQLEAHRKPLLALAAKVQFPATVEKVNGLCDGISYLVLQQVLGSI